MYGYWIDNVDIHLFHIGVDYMNFPPVNKIPIQLRNPAFRFIKVRKGDKRPLEAHWTTELNYPYDAPELQNWLNEGGNYGVLGGYGNLVIVDFDDLAAQKAIGEVPDTFVVKSGGRGAPHLYFILDKPIAKYPIKDSHGRTLIDVQGMGAQVVGPNSKLVTGGKYEVASQFPIATITEAELAKLLLPVSVTIQHAPEIKPKKMAFPVIAKEDSEVTRIKAQVRISEVLSTFGIDVRHRPCMCPLGHPSQGGKCFSYDNSLGLGHCFNCGWGGDTIKLVMDKKSMTFPEALQWIKKEFGINGDVK
jgi:hypothetical protein